MPKDDSKSTKKPTTKPSGRSFCCSMFIYTFVFVSGVVVATILPDLAGHHFKQPYGKEYGVMAERLVQDLPKHLKTLQETAMVLGSQVADRLWALKSEVERRINEMSAKPNEKAKTKTATERPSTRNHDHVHSARTPDAKHASSAGSGRPTKANDF